MLELLSEPLYILAAVQLRFRLRALADTAAIVAKSGVAIALLQVGPAAMPCSPTNLERLKVTDRAFATPNDAYYPANT